MDTVGGRLMRRVQRAGRGWVFVPTDFIDVAARAAVDQALSRLAKAGKIRRLARGLYDYPRIHPRLGPLSASPDSIASALARKTGSDVQVTGAQAANALGLSTQVPARPVYLTNGPSRDVAIGNRRVALRHVSPKHFAGAGTPAGRIVQALRYLGPDAVRTVADTFAPRLSDADRRRLLRDKTLAPDWMRPAIDRIADGARSA